MNSGQNIYYNSALNIIRKAVTIKVITHFKLIELETRKEMKNKLLVKVEIDTRFNI